MRVPSYRRHSSGQARVTIHGRDYLLGEYDSEASRTEYARIIAEYLAANKSRTFRRARTSLTVADVLMAFIKHAKVYYNENNEYDNLRRATGPVARLYADMPAEKFGVGEYKAVRQDWLSDPDRSRQYVNSQMKRLRHIVKWAVGEGLMTAEQHQSICCIAPLKKGRCTAKEAPGVKPVCTELVKQTIEHLTPVLADMVRFQLLTGCRPGELCRISPGMVDRSESVWVIELKEHKTEHRGKKRFIYVGPQAQKVLTPYLFRDPALPCFSPAESEEQRRAAGEAARTTPRSCGNRRGKNRTKNRKRPPSTSYDTRSYAKAISYACRRAKLEHWSPNQLRHNAATAIRKQFGLDAATVILGHSDVGITQVYAELDREKAIEIARKIG